MWIKERYFVKEKKHIPKGEKYLSESSHEGESKGESWFQGEAKPSLDGGKHPSHGEFGGLTRFGCMSRDASCKVFELKPSCGLKISDPNSPPLHMR